MYWAALRSGLYITAVNWHLTASEAAYIVDDCEATILVASGQASAAVPLDEKLIPRVRHRLVYGGALEGFDDYEEAVDAQSTAPLDSQPRGADMLYSSGTTGRPKGIKGDLPEVR